MLGFSVSSCPPSAALQALSGGEETEKGPIRLRRKLHLDCLHSLVSGPIELLVRMLENNDTLGEGLGLRLAAGMQKCKSKIVLKNSPFSYILLEARTLKRKLMLFSATRGNLIL